MHNLYPFALCVLLAVASSSANSFGKDTPRPPVSFTTYPPGVPTPIPEPHSQLPPGQRFAKPEYNPLYRPGALVYGPSKVVKFNNFTLPSPDDVNPICPRIRGRVEERWGKHLYSILYPNGTVQSVGFPLSIFKELEVRNPKIVSEITSSRHLVYAPKSNPHNSSHDARDLEKRYIFGADGRLEVFDTGRFPFSTVGMVGSGCTGTLVGPRHILTAGHCVHSGGLSGSWTTNLDFTIPRLNQTFPWYQAFASNGWLLDRDWDHDYALIVLQDTQTEFPWMAFGYDEGLDDDWYVNINAFQPRDTMWHTEGYITDKGDEWFHVDADLVPENGGSAVYVYYLSGRRIIYGIFSNEWHQVVRNFPDFWNTHTNVANSVVRISGPKFYTICSWIGWHCY